MRRKPPRTNTNTEATNTERMTRSGNERHHTLAAHFDHSERAVSEIGICWAQGLE
jgi:hypothetical protein